VIKSKTILSAVLTLALTSVVTTAPAQEISIPDPGLNAAIRQTLQKPTGPLTEQDLLGLTSLTADDRNITNIAGLEAARNLVTLSLQSNHLANLSIPGGLTKLITVDLSSNPLTSCSFPDGLTNLHRLIIKASQLTSLTLPSDLRVLIELDLSGNQFTDFHLPSNLVGVGVLDLSANQLASLTLSSNLTELESLQLENNRLTSFTLSSNLAGRMFFLDLSFNMLSNCALPGGMTNLDTLSLEANRLSNFTLPSGLIRLTYLALWQNRLTSFTMPAETTNLISLLLNGNQFTNVVLPPNLNRLNNLDLGFNLLQSLSLPAGLTGLENLSLLANQLTGLTIPADMTNLSFLDIDANQLLSFTLPEGLTELKSLRLGGNKLGSFTLPRGLTNLTLLALAENQLTNLTLPSDLIHASQLDLGENQFANFTFPAGLINLSDVDLGLCQLTNLTLPPDLTNLSSIFLGGNPLTTFVLSETLAASNLAATVTDLQNRGVQVFTYPLTVQLTFPREQRIGAFRFGITGPPGVYAVFSSSNLTDWNALNFASNSLGSVLFTDVEAHLAPRKYYRALLVAPPTNMVFIAPNVFTLGSPANEVGHRSDESPQTDVSLTHGFWMAKYLVTQRDYLAVTGENPSQFHGNLDLPVESVSWFAASNYCVLLTAQDRAAGRIPPGSQYRLPTEAEWECAARAGSTTRFNYGDDPNVTSLTNHAWYSANSGFRTQPVGQKLPNALGLYDMAGDVWEWCQDWYGDYPGGDITDPQGPATNPIGWKVIRGGAWEASDLDCRSARRGFEGASPFISDFIIGFRVVLIIGAQ